MSKEAKTADSVRDSVRGQEYGSGITADSITAGVITCSAVRPFTRSCVNEAAYYGMLAIHFANSGDESRARTFAKYAGRWANRAYVVGEVEA